MAEDKIGSPLRMGLLIVALTWFLFTFYEFIKGAFNIFKGTFWIELTDTAGVIGLGFRAVAGFIAVITILFFIFRKDLSKPETMMSLRWIVLGEAVCFLSLFLVVIWGLDIFSNFGFGEFGFTFFIGSTIPVLFESVMIPFVLVKLFFALMAQGVDYVLLYPANIFSFVLTTVGLFVLGLYSAYFTKKSIDKGQLENVELSKVGLIITSLGLYFLIIYVMWLLFGSVGGWSDWYAWFLGHNVELWMIVLPFVGVPLLFKKSSK